MDGIYTCRSIISVRYRNSPGHLVIMLLVISLGC